jgi:excisionase family DNA binding protein
METIEPSNRLNASKAYDPKFPVRRAAELLGVSLSHTWRLIWSRKLGSYQIAGRTLVGLSHIETYLKNAERKNCTGVNESEKK